jgi:nucleolar MIF4G domain-containing protein 1
VRILHHDLIVDIITFLSQLRNTAGELDEKQIELLVTVVECCGPQLRSDDPGKLRDIINVLSVEAEKHTRRDTNSRASYLLTSLTELRNNKSKRTENEVSTEIKKLRKWLGALKTTFASGSKNYTLRVGLTDLLEAEKKGRWWRAGASWAGKEGKDFDKSGIKNGKGKEESEGGKNGEIYSDDADKEAANAEEQQLLKMAVKMRLNTDTRKKIFVVMMSSRDVSDAFERLARLELKGKQDREVVRVIVECCGQEKDFNSFYPELAGLMCSQNRQFKTTLQFSLWDLLKALQDGQVRILLYCCSLDLLLPGCLHSLTPPGTTLTTIPFPQSIINRHNTRITYYFTGTGAKSHQPRAYVCLFSSGFPSTSVRAEAYRRGRHGKRHRALSRHFLYGFVYF